MTRPPPRLRLLVSVRTVAEALLAADAGADFIDLKEPRAGALGGLPVDEIARIVAALRASARPPAAVSATIGDLPLDDSAAVLAAVRRVAACGVNYVKVGIGRVREARAVLDVLRASGVAVIPVFIADRGLDLDAVAAAGAAGFPGVMVDTADKRAGSLFDVVEPAVLRSVVDRVQAAGAMAGLAGALRLAQLPALAELAPDFAGFRSAVCVGDRGAALDAGLLATLIRTATELPVLAQTRRFVGAASDGFNMR